MTQENYMSPKQIKAVTPHIRKFVENTHYNTLNNIKKSSDFIELMDKYLTTENYTNKIKSFITEDILKKYADTVISSVNNFYKETSGRDINSYIKHVIAETYFLISEHRITYPPIWSDKIKFTIDNIYQILKKIISEEEDRIIDYLQKSYAISEMKLHTWISSDTYNKLDAVLATAQCNSLEDLEQFVLNNFDFESLILG